MTRRTVLVLFCLVASCSAGPPRPVALQQGLPCAQCRMTIVDPRLASQIVADGEDPKFFDDIGCLARHLAEHPLAAGASAFVADHGSGEWVAADRALYSRNAALDTPMGSHIFAHASEQSRAQDGSARSAERLDARDIVGRSTVRP